MNNLYFVETAVRQRSCHGEPICGDMVLLRKLSGGNKTVIVLSDGMGHGVKANILATLTATMLLDFISKNRDIRKTAERILSALPVCSSRKISYATFTCAEIDHRSGVVTLVEHGNPHAQLFRKGRLKELIWAVETICPSDGRERTIHSTRFQSEAGDRLLFMSDGMTLSGQGSERYPFGWSLPQVVESACRLLSQNPEISAAEMATSLLAMAMEHDKGRPGDDVSCVSVYIRIPRRMLLVSCPPSSKMLYGELIRQIESFEGKKAICGYPVAEIVALQQGVQVPVDPADQWHLPQIDLVTEGLLTLNTVCDLLEQRVRSVSPDSPAQRLTDLLLVNDEVHFLIGNKRKISSNLYTPDEFEMRRRILKRIAALLEDQYDKRISITYL